MKGFVVSVLAIGALVAFMAPQRPDRATPGAAAGAAAGPADKHLAVTTTPASFGGEMALDREADGHFYATVEVDGRDYRMLVDTGATVVALTGDDARAMGLDWDPNALAPVARGASGPVLGVPVTIDAMTIGDFEARGVQALIVPEGLGVSLLGQSFLSHVPKVDISGDRLTLSG
jgi:aspartyl protease family protein